MTPSDAPGTESADTASKPAPPKPVPPAPPPEPNLSSYSWYSGHHTLLLTLSYVIQTRAIKCTSALVVLPVFPLPSSLLAAGEDPHQDLQASVGAARGTAGPSSTPGCQQGQGALLCLQHCSVCVGRVVHLLL